MTPTKTASTTLRISPSDLSFALDECERCLWRKIVKGEKKPRSPMPSIFRTIDGGMKRVFDGARAEVVMPDIGVKGRFEVRKQMKVRSIDMKAPESNQAFVISGIMDSIIECDDGLVAIPDFKTSMIKPAYVAKYGRQLHGYRFCLENPPAGIKPRKVGKLGLIAWTPGPEGFASSTPGLGNLEANMVWVSVPNDEQAQDAFQDTIADLLELLTGDEPAGDPDCEWCKSWRN